MTTPPAEPSSLARVVRTVSVGALVVASILWAAATAASIIGAEPGRYAVNVVLTALFGGVGSACVLLGALRHNPSLLTVGALGLIPWLAAEVALGSS